MFLRPLLLPAVVLIVLSVGCGGPHPATTADVAALPQPTPDPTLDAVVRGGAAWLPVVTPTPTAPPVVAHPTSRPAPSRPAATPTRTPARSR